VTPVNLLRYGLAVASHRPEISATGSGRAAMKTIGLLGGMSWESSIIYERIMNEEVRRRLGGIHSADLLIRS